MKTAAAGVLLLCLGLLAPVAPAAADEPSATTSTSAATAVTPTATVSAKAGEPWVPRTGPTFNTPTGSGKAQRAIVHEVHSAIVRSPAGSTIRFASYNIDRNDTARHLIRAKRRGVNVQVVVNDNLVGKVERRLQKVLGKKRSGKSFFVICHAACRNKNKKGNMHLKMYTFSQSGAASNVIISSSGNLSGGAARAQWNDAYTLYGDDALFATWVKLFNQLRNDRKVTPRRVSYRTENLGYYFQKKLMRSVGKVNSGVSGAPMARMKRVGCSAPAGYGVRGRTKVRINMYAWYGTRGDAIARSVVKMKKRGCDVAVIGSVMSKKVTSILQGAGIRVRAADWDWGDKLPLSGADGIVFGSRCYSHLKVMTIDGTYKGKPTKLVFTGSENWSGPAVSSDELVLEIHNKRVMDAYNARWNVMWKSKNATHAAGVKPTRRPCR